MSMLLLEAFQFSLQTQKRQTTLGGWVSLLISFLCLKQIWEELQYCAIAQILSLQISRHAVYVQAKRLLGAAGLRRYLLESPDFWAMRELRELSKGAFSQLPAWLETVAQKAAQLATSALLTAAQEQQQSKGQHHGRMRT